MKRREENKRQPNWMYDRSLGVPSMANLPGGDGSCVYSCMPRSMELTEDSTGVTALIPVPVRKDGGVELYIT